jgi:hypothetical protein
VLTTEVLTIDVLTIDVLTIDVLTIDVLTMVGAASGAVRTGTDGTGRRTDC